MSFSVPPGVREEALHARRDGRARGLLDIVLTPYCPKTRRQPTLAESSARSNPGLTFSDEQRRRLAIKGKELSPAERKACCQIVSPPTLLDWFRKLAAKKYDSSTKRKPGRPRTKHDIRQLVIRLAEENPSWGYTKIRDALWGLKHDIARSTVASILEEAGIEPAPERSRKKTWKQFLESHWGSLYACDFFTVEALGAFGSVRYLVFFVMALKTREVHIAGVRIAPNDAWMKQMARNLLDCCDGFLRNATHLIHDRDPLFSKAWRTMLGERHLRHLVR